MSYTTLDIQNALEKQIDYSELCRILELDLQNIAEQVIENPEETITFEVFFDSGEFETAISDSMMGEGEGFLKTPVLLKFVNGTYSTKRGPKFFSNVFSIEVMGFEKDRTNLRKIFETYSYMNQGLIDKDELGIYITKTLEFPFFDEPFQLKGETRFQGFMRLFLNYMYNGQMSNEVVTLLDDDPIDILNFNIKKTKISDTIHRNNELNSSTMNKSQIMVFNGAMVYDGTDAAKKLLKNIKDLDAGLNDEFELTITYPSIFNLDDEPETNTYTVVITDGDITIVEGGYINLSFTMALA